tara:strand:- start:4727 stop:5119 length:393 start_codon:yes stop_codon:yes gene_type:complete
MLTIDLSRQRATVECVGTRREYALRNPLTTAYWSSRSFTFQNQAGKTVCASQNRRCHLRHLLRRLVDVAPALGLASRAATSTPRVPRTPDRHRARRPGAYAVAELIGFKKKERSPMRSASQSMLVRGVVL